LRQALPQQAQTPACPFPRHRLCRPQAFQAHVTYRLGSRRTGGLLALVVANATYVAPRPGAGGPLARRYLELAHAHVESVACMGGVPAGGNGEEWRAEGALL
jgi:hypothetical protein